MLLWSISVDPHFQTILSYIFSVTHGIQMAVHVSLTSQHIICLQRESFFSVCIVSVLFKIWVSSVLTPKHRACVWLVSRCTTNHAKPPSLCWGQCAYQITVGEREQGNYFYRQSVMTNWFSHLNPRQCTRRSRLTVSPLNDPFSLSFTDQRHWVINNWRCWN